ncbi:hypothetical protein ACHAXH_000094 [Discostella pseudostelligera]
MDSFWRLHSILLPHIRTAADATSGYERKGGRNGGNYSLPPIPNGPITSSIRLGAALRYFAGGSAYDITCVFAISYSEVLSSVWIVVDAINNCSDFDISYPKTIEEQRSIAAGFESASAPGFRNCAGAIDGILIWMLKPSLEEAKKTGVDQKRYLCGRKHKFGLNCQAVSDCRGRILDISIKCGGAPFTNVAGDPNRAAEDAYNFYHSQLRIRVECCFGMLVQRWGLLRMAMPRNLTVTKVVALVIALAKLHNFCIGESDVVPPVPQVFDRDRYHMMNRRGGYVGLGNDNPQQNTVVPTDLIHLGEHFDDVPEAVLRSRRRQNAQNQLPRTQLFNMIVDGHWTRPTRVGSRRR